MACIYLMCMMKFVLSWFVSFMQTLRKWNPRGGARTYNTTKIKDTIITFTIISIERIFNLDPNPSKFPLSMSDTKNPKLYLDKYVPS